MPMMYFVSARFYKSKIPEFYKKLTDGTISSRKPDGNEIVNSMKRAKLTDDNAIQWSEMCFCDPPLKHEKETVYDKYLYDMKTEPIEGYIEFDGESFMNYMKQISKE